MVNPSLLIGDIGGTNARFALAHPEEPGFSGALTLYCADYETAEHGVADYLQRSGNVAPDVICLAAAGPVVDDCVRFTNNHWVIDNRQLRQKFPSTPVRLLNDFEAIAWSIPMLADNDLATVGPALSELKGQSEFTVAVIGPGTGLGVGGLLGRANGVYPLAGGVIKRYPALLKTSSFRAGFENKGRYRSLLERVPTLLILHPQPGLLGASYCARELYQQTAV